MTRYFISRHEGAIRWAEANGIEAVFLAHLDPQTLGAGDVVIGTLPFQLVEQALHQGARYIHLVIPLKPQERGLELTAIELQSKDVQMIEYSLSRINTFSADTLP